MARKNNHTLGSVRLTPETYRKLTKIGDKAGLNRTCTAAVLLNDIVHRISLDDVMPPRRTILKGESGEEISKKD